MFGTVAPSGRLAESIPLRLQDTPAYLNFPGEHDVVRYGEGVFVGYRYYETAEVPVRYPFGHGLGYTSFEYSDLVVSRNGHTARVTVTNSGRRQGMDVVQLYVSSPGGDVRMPRRQLRAFEKVSLAPGESARVEFALDLRAFSHWDARDQAWVVSGDRHVVEVGRSAHDIVLSADVNLARPRVGRLTLDSRVSEFLEHPVTGPILARTAAGEGGGPGMLDMVASMPMRRLMRFPGVGTSMDRLPVLIAIANNPVVRGVAGWLRRR